MSDQWMDRLAAGFATGSSRRRTMKAALGVGVGTALRLLGARQSQADVDCKEVRARCREHCSRSSTSTGHGQCILDCLRRGKC